jgi:hypothetical protein
MKRGIKEAGFSSLKRDESGFLEMLASWTYDTAREGCLC